ncbi:hypothetical protein JQU68_12160 [Sulfitobacter mediterraneus]|nr:hypothetical protein [Sulfitobacter mediterraneus]
MIGLVGEKWAFAGAKQAYYNRNQLQTAFEAYITALTGDDVPGSYISSASTDQYSPIATI